MQEIVLVIHLIIAIALVVTVLLQHSEGGALGIGGGTSGLVSARGAANLLTRTTAILAACFFVTSLTLTVLATRDASDASLLDAPVTEEEAPRTEPVLPKAPAVPFSEQ